MQAKWFHQSKKKRSYRAVLIGLLLALMTLALYWPVQSFDFVNYDDEVYVTSNRHVRGGLSLEGIQWSFANVDAGFWQPPVWLSHMLDCQLFGMHAGGHHWTSVLIHTASALLLFFVLSLMTHSPWAGALVAALFAVHPLHVESVAWVAERKDVLSGFFWILTMGAYAHYVKVPTLRRYLLVLGSFVLGLLSKPMVVTFHSFCCFSVLAPAEVHRAETAFDRWCACGRAPMRTPGARLVAEKVPLVVLSAAVGGLTYVAEQQVGAVQSMASYSFGVRLANAIVSYALYIRKTIWPVDLAVYYPHFGMPPLWLVMASAVLLVAVTGVAWHLRTQFIPAVGWFGTWGRWSPSSASSDRDARDGGSLHLHPSVGTVHRPGLGGKRTRRETSGFENQHHRPFDSFNHRYAVSRQGTDRDLAKQRHPFRACHHGDKGQPHCPIQHRCPLSG
jgi:hypothetical protein